MPTTHAPSPCYAAFYDDIFVGCVCGLLEPATSRLYIPVIAVLAPYRDRGIGRQLMEELLEGVSRCVNKKLVEHL